MELTSLNSAQIAATAFLHALGPAWVNRHVRWLDIKPFDSDHQSDLTKVNMHVRVQISASVMRGTVVMLRDTLDEPWLLSGMESYLGHTGTLKQGVRFGYCKQTRQIKTENV